jgi:hypothetical protein
MPNFLFGASGATAQDTFGSLMGVAVCGPMLSLKSSGMMQ